MRSIRACATGCTMGHEGHQMAAGGTIIPLWVLPPSEGFRACV